MFLTGVYILIAIFFIENTVTCTFKQDTNTSGFRLPLTNAQTYIHNTYKSMLNVVSSQK